MLITRSGTGVNHQPERHQDFMRWSREMGERFPDAELQIRDELSGFIDDRIEKYGWDRGAGFCSSWIPGPEWGEGSGV